MNSGIINPSPYDLLIDDEQRRTHIMKQLSDALECGLEIYRKREEWVLQTRSFRRGYASEQLDIRERLKQFTNTDQPTIERLSENEVLFVLPLKQQHREEPGVIVGITALPTEVLLEKFLMIHQFAVNEQSKNEIQNEQLELYAAQVSSDFEELTWLRNLSHQVERCTISTSISELAESTFPLMQDLVNCRAIYFQPLPLGASWADCQELIHWGDTSDIADASRILEICREKEMRAPQILDRSSVNPEFRQLPGKIRNCLVVPVIQGEDLYGTIIAIDRQSNVDMRHHLNDLIHPDAFLEFGTAEASLFQSVAMLLSVHAKNLHALEKQKELLSGVVKALINSLDARDPYTCGHSDRVAQYARIIAKGYRLSHDQCERIYLSGLVHDVGKVGVPDAILKKPGRLTDEEFDVVKQHPEIGYHILKHLKAFDYVLPGVLHHHEALDGTGYPHGLKGDEIPLMARMLAVADTFDALTSNRPYRDGMPIKKAVVILQEGSGTQWDPQCVEIFLDRMDDVLDVIEQAEIHKEQTLRFIDESDERVAEVDSVMTATKATARI